MEYIFATNINKTGLSGIINVKSNPPKILCYCNEANAKIILEALEAVKK